MPGDEVSRKHAWISSWKSRRYDETDLVAATAPGPAGHLLQLASGKWTPTVISASVRIA